MPEPFGVVPEVTATVNTVIAEVKPAVTKDATSLLSKVGKFFSGLWTSLLTLEAKTNTWLANLKGATTLVLGVAGLVGAGALEITGILRVPEVVVPAIIKAIQFVVDAIFKGVEFLVPNILILLPMIIAAIAVYLIVTALKKK